MNDGRTAAILERAHALWIAEGKPEGRAEANWKQAEQEYDAGRLPRSGDPSGPDPPEREF